MKLSDQCCSLDQAKRLKELGVTAYGLFVHYLNRELPSDKGIKPKQQTASWAAIGEIKDGGVITYFPAYTVAELGVMLPDLIETDRQYELVTIKEDDCWLVRYVAGNDLKNAHPSYQAETSEAQARAAILIWLLANNIITPSEVNSRLNQ
jgi:hypothetical protein